MKDEPPIDRVRLLTTVRQVYGLPVDELVFVPEGFAAAGYAVQAAGETRYFLKLWPETRAGRDASARQDVILPLLRAFHERVPHPRVPYPILTRDGAPSATFSGMRLALFPFLPGHAAPPYADLPLPLRDELARSVALIHRATPSLADVLPPRETFEVPFEPQLLRGLSSIRQIGPEVRPGLRALRGLILPRCDEILEQLERLYALQLAARQISGPLVLCHTDLGGDNLLIDERGQLAVLDWDDAVVGPPEHDLQTAVGPGFARFLEVYLTSGGVRDLHLAHFAFCLLRRYLADMTARLVRILEENSSWEQDEECLQGIEEWGFAQWARLDERLEGIADALRGL